MKKLFTILFIISSTSVLAEIDKNKLKNCAQELIKGELSGRHIDGKSSCLKKDKYKLNKVYSDVYEELDTSKLKYIKIDSLNITNIKRIDDRFERYQASFTVKSEDGKETYNDSINFSINSKKNQKKYGLANILKSTDQVFLRADCK